MQYLDTGGFAIVFVLALIFFVLFNIVRAHGKEEGLFIRRIPGLNALDDAIGRATEMGRPILMIPGIGTLNAISVQALSIFAHVSKSAAQFSTPIRLCCADAAVYTVAQEIIKDVYQEQGMISRYDAEMVQFVSDRQFAFAAGVSGIILREQAAAAFLLGEFYAESLIFAETCNSVGAIQVAGSTQTTQTPFFIAACDYVLIGDEFYAASAYLKREPVLVGSLVGQDWGKLMIGAFVILGCLGTSYEMTQPVGTVWQSSDVNGFFEEANTDDREEGSRQEGLKRRSETFTQKLFSPKPDIVLLDSIEREQKPVDEPEASGGEAGE